MEINKLITETIDEFCEDKPEVKELIYKVIDFELDTWNRHPTKNEIEGRYEHIVEKIIRRSNK